MPRPAYMWEDVRNLRWMQCAKCGDAVSHRWRVTGGCERDRHCDVEERWASRVPWVGAPTPWSGVRTHHEAVRDRQPLVQPGRAVGLVGKPRRLEQRVQHAREGQPVMSATRFDSRHALVVSAGRPRAPHVARSAPPPRAGIRRLDVRNFKPRELALERGRRGGARIRTLKRVTTRQSTYSR